MAAKKQFCRKCNGDGFLRDSTIPSAQWPTCDKCKGTGYQKKGKK